MSIEQTMYVLWPKKQECKQECKPGKKQYKKHNRKQDGNPCLINRINVYTTDTVSVNLSNVFTVYVITMLFAVQLCKPE